MLLAMIASGSLCFLIGSYLPFLYSLLPDQQIPYFTPYDSYHLSETLQILAFTGLGFMLFQRPDRCQGDNKP
jgi:multicomponent Na+:H+ antiporter subunit D